MKNTELELYTDYLLSTFGAATATGLSAMVEGDVSHDRITRLLSKQAYASKDLWLQVKAMVRSVQSDEGVLVFDDTIQLGFIHSSRITKRVDKAIDQRARDFHHVRFVVGD